MNRINVIAKALHAYRCPLERPDHHYCDLEPFEEEAAVRIDAALQREESK